MPRPTSVTITAPDGRSATAPDEQWERVVTGALGDIVASDEVRAVAERLIADHLRWSFLRSRPIAYLVDRRKDAAEPKPGAHAFGDVRLVPALWRGLAGVEAALIVKQVAWDSLTDRQREALVHHLLMHLDVNQKGALVLAGHDLEEFGATVREYGQWMPDVEHFAEQLGMFEASAA